MSPYFLDTVVEHISR